MFRRILVPLDGSAFAEHALPYALSIAHRSEASLHVARVHIPVLPPYAEGLLALGDQADNVVRREENAYLERSVERLQRLASLPVRSVLLDDGESAQQIAAYAVECTADLVVMTTHGRGGIARAWLGSVADQLVRQVNVPLLLVRPRDDEAHLDQTIAFRRVLFPLDGSPQGESMLQPAMALAGGREAEYTLLRVLNPPVLGTQAIDPIRGPLPDAHLLESLQRIHEQEQQQAKTYLADLSRRQEGRTVHTAVAVHEQPAQAILEEAQRRQIDLIALPTHGRWGMARFFLGSIADKVLRGATVPVLIQRLAG